MFGIVSRNIKVNFSRNAYSRVFSQVSKVQPLRESRPYAEQWMLHNDQKAKGKLRSIFATIQGEVLRSYKSSRFKNPFADNASANPTIFFTHAYPIVERFPHEEWTPIFLLQLVSDLFLMGFDCKIDMLHSRCGVNMVDFMRENIFTADIIIHPATHSSLAKITESQYAQSMIRHEFNWVNDRIVRHTSLMPVLPSGVIPLQLTGKDAEDVFVPPYRGHYAAETFQGNESYFLTLIGLIENITSYFEDGMMSSSHITAKKNDPDYWYNRVISDVRSQPELSLFLERVDEYGVAQLLSKDEKDKKAFESAQKNNLEEALVTVSLNWENVKDNIEHAKSEKVDVNISKPFKLAILASSQDTSILSNLYNIFQRLHPVSVALTKRKAGKNIFDTKKVFYNAEYVIGIVNKAFFKDHVCMELFVYFLDNNLYDGVSTRLILTDNEDPLMMLLEASQYWKEKCLKMKMILDEMVKNEHEIPRVFREQHAVIEKIYSKLENPTLLDLLRNFPLNWEQVKVSKDLIKLFNFSDRMTDGQKFFKQMRPLKNTYEPEFPPESPKFPATSTDSFYVETPRKRGRNIFIKNESTNLTGTHKDRMAWEVVQYYKRYAERILGLVGYHNDLHALFAACDQSKLPICSIITAGCAGVAIQTQFNYYGLPRLRVLIDERLKEKPQNGLNIYDTLEKIGCEVYTTDLAACYLNSNDILKKTENPNGWDLTDSRFIDPKSDIYYDWLSFEILNTDADYYFIPFGTGELFSNVLSVCNATHYGIDPRLQRKEELKNIRFFGATTKNPSTRMDKIYCPHRSSPIRVNEALERGIATGRVHPESRIQHVLEDSVSYAMLVATAIKLSAEPSGLAGLALYLQVEDTLPPDAKVCIINTGKLKLPPSSFFRNKSEVRHLNDSDVPRKSITI